MREYLTTFKATSKARIFFPMTKTGCQLVVNNNRLLQSHSSNSMVTKLRAQWLPPVRSRAALKSASLLWLPSPLVPPPPPPNPPELPSPLRWRRLLQLRPLRRQQQQWEWKIKRNKLLRHVILTMMTTFEKLYHSKIRFHRHWCHRLHHPHHLWAKIIWKKYYWGLKTRQCCPKTLSK